LATLAAAQLVVVLPPVATAPCVYGGAKVVLPPVAPAPCVYGGAKVEQLAEQLVLL
jgi:hypothetical protein